MINRIYLNIFSSDSFPNEETCVKEELSKVTQEDEAVVIQYLLDIMRAHDIITEEEYQAVLYKYN